MPQIDLGQVVGPQGAQGEPGPQGAQGIQGPAGPAATINGVNALIIEAGNNIELSQSGSTTTLSVPTDAAPTEDSTKPVQSGGVAAALSNKAPAGFGLGTIVPKLAGTADGILENCFFAAKNNTPFADWAYGLCISRLEGVKLQIMWSEQGSAYTFLDGCYAIRIMKSGVWMPWEYVNPPMQLGVEYRTTERYNGKPVYMKLVDCGAGPNNTRKTVSANTQNVETPISCTGTFGNGTIPYEWFAGDSSGAQAITCTFSGQEIHIAATADYSMWTVFVILKYTKTTD